MVKDIEMTEKIESRTTRKWMIRLSVIGISLIVWKSTVKVARFFHMAIIRSIYTTITKIEDQKRHVESNRDLWEVIPCFVLSGSSSDGRISEISGISKCGT